MANGIGSAIANRRKRKAEEAYQAAINREMGELDAEIGANYLDSATARNAIRKVTDANAETLRQLNTQAIRGGATDEAKVAMASKLSKSNAEVVGDLAAIGEQRKDALKHQKRNLRLVLAQHQYTQDADTSGIDNILSAVGTAANTIGSAWSTKHNTPSATTEQTTTPPPPPTPEQENTIAKAGTNSAAPAETEWAESTMDAGERMAARMRGASTIPSDEEQIKYGK